MKPKRKLFLRVLAGLAGAGIVVFILVFAVALLGNPLSPLLIHWQAGRYLDQTYPYMELEREWPQYSFKTGGYYVHVQQPGSKDIHFSLDYSAFGKLQYDSYENDVLDGNSTLSRLDREYRALGDEVLESPNFPWESDIAFVTLRADDLVDPPPGSGYGLDMGTLEPDGEYDVSKMGAQHGELVLYVDCDEVSAAQAAEILLDVKERFDGAGVGVYAVSLVVRQTPAGDTRDPDAPEFHTANFRWEDIVPEGLEERLEENRAALNEYYARMDRMK